MAEDCLRRVVYPPVGRYCHAAVDTVYDVFDCDDDRLVALFIALNKAYMELDADDELSNVYYDPTPCHKTIEPAPIKPTGFRRLPYSGVLAIKMMPNVSAEVWVFYVYEAFGRIPGVGGFKQKGKIYSTVSWRVREGDGGGCKIDNRLLELHGTHDVYLRLDEGVRRDDLRDDVLAEIARTPEDDNAFELRLIREEVEGQEVYLAIDRTVRSLCFGF